MFRGTLRSNGASHLLDKRIVFVTRGTRVQIDLEVWTTVSRALNRYLLPVVHEKGILRLHRSDET